MTTIDVNTATPEELIARLERLREQRFYLSMKDRWSADDFDTDRTWFQEELAIRKKLGL